MLDSLMIDLANAEQEQERWFNRSISGAREEEEVSHQETIMEEAEADWEADDAESSDDESEYEEEQIKPFTDFSDEDMEFDDEEDSTLSLTRTASRQQSPPALTLDYESDSDEEHMPPSPPNLSIESLTKEQKAPMDTTSFYPSLKDASQTLESDYYQSSRQEPTIIAAY